MWHSENTMSVLSKAWVLSLLLLLVGSLTGVQLHGQGVLQEQLQGSYSGQWTFEGLDGGPMGFPQYRKKVVLVLPQYAEVLALPGDTLALTFDSLAVRYCLKHFYTHYAAQTRSTSLFYEFAGDTLGSHELELLTADERLRLTFKLQQPLPSWPYTGSKGAGEASALGELHEERLSFRFLATYAGTFDAQPMEGRCALLLTLIRTQSPRSQRDAQRDSLSQRPHSGASMHWGRSEKPLGDKGQGRLD